MGLAQLVIPKYLNIILIERMTQRSRDMKDKNRNPIVLQSSDDDYENDMTDLGYCPVDEKECGI